MIACCRSPSSCFALLLPSFSLPVLSCLASPRFALPWTPRLPSGGFLPTPFIGVRWFVFRRFLLSAGRKAEPLRSPAVGLLTQSVTQCFLDRSLSRPCGKFVPSTNEILGLPRRRRPIGPTGQASTIHPSIHSFVGSFASRSIHLFICSSVVAVGCFCCYSPVKEREITRVRINVTAKMDGQLYSAAAPSFSSPPSSPDRSANARTKEASTTGLFALLCRQLASLRTPLRNSS